MEVSRDLRVEYSVIQVVGVKLAVVVDCAPAVDAPLATSLKSSGTSKNSCQILDLRHFSSLLYNMPLKYSSNPLRLSSIFTGSLTLLPNRDVTPNDFGGSVAGGGEENSVVRALCKVSNCE